MLVLYYALCTTVLLTAILYIDWTTRTAWTRTRSSWPCKLGYIHPLIIAFVMHMFNDQFIVSFVSLVHLVLLEIQYVP